MNASIIGERKQYNRDGGCRERGFSTGKTLAFQLLVAISAPCLACGVGVAMHVMRQCCKCALTAVQLLHRIGVSLQSLSAAQTCPTH